jgi:nitric oxide reductase activation protein
MNEYSNDHHIDQHPEKLKRTGPVPKPWWGDILPDLLKKTDETITWVTEKAIEQYEDIPPELLESLLSTMMAGGQREPDMLWKLLGEMLNNIEFTSPDAEELAESVKTFFYKEWDQKIADYKLDWCQVRQRIAKEDPNDFVIQIKERLGGIISLIRKQFMKLKPENFRKYRAQPTGDALDIDALVQTLTDMRSGAAMSENVYIRRDKRIRDVAVFFLVDLSGSTDEPVNGRRIIDIQKEAMVIMAEALEALGDPYAIYGFSSEGRFRVDMFNVKDFNEPYDEKVQYRLGNLEPLGLTRLGAVVRHSTAKLEDVDAVIKLLVILTDGRPYDMEYGNLEYAISDTKKAIQKARSKNIHPFIITSDQKGSDYLQMISPQTECVILPKVELLPTLLPALYRRLTV